MKTSIFAGPLGRAFGLAVLSYGLAVLVLGFLAWLGLAGLSSRYAAYSSMAERLARLESHAQGAGQMTEGSGEDMQGSPFLEGDTLTIAGAALQKRVTGAVEEASGHVLSSQIDLQPGEAEDDRVSLTISFEMEQAGLQKLLYDLETGMPFLFVDRLAIQSPEVSEGEASRLRITTTVTGQWQRMK